jgi:ABC-2 type transport system ATP-binding protein
MQSTMSESPAVDVANLGKQYRDGLLGRRRIDALDGVSLSVERGEIFGLLGPNGAGKTTLIKVLLGIVSASRGEAALLGMPGGSRAARKHVGYLPENHRIPRHHTGNSALAFFGSLSGLSGAEVRARRDPLLKAVGMQDWGRTPIRKYSKGMLQRLGLAQAMLHDPQLLILDEPTDGVDPVGRSEMRAILQGLKAAGKTIFINSHLLQEVELVCDRVAILDRGKVLYQGRIAELTRHRGGSQVRIGVAGTEAAVRAALADAGGSEAGGADIRRIGPDQFEVLLRETDQAAIDRTVDRLRSQSLSLVSMTRNAQTLEEAFLDILQQARGK